MDIAWLDLTQEPAALLPERASAVADLAARGLSWV